MTATSERRGGAAGTRQGPFDLSLSPSKRALLDRWWNRDFREDDGKGHKEGSSIARRGRSGPIPLSLAQQRVWFMEQWQPRTAAYNLSFCARVDMDIAPQLLAKSLQDLVNRHEILRTTVRLHRGEPHQFVAEGEFPSLEVVDFREAGNDGLDAARRRMDEAIHQPFDLARGPLGRFLLCRLQEGDVIGLVVHHLVGDGWSLGVALTELSALYEARASGKTPSLLPPPIQYGDFAVWQRDQARADTWVRDLSYWEERLADLPPLELPTDRPRPPVASFRGDWKEFRLPRPLSDAVRRLARQESVTPFTVLLATLKVLLLKLTHQRDFTVGTVVANRTLPETHGLIGNFINMLPLRTDLRGDPTFREVLGRVRTTCVTGFAHQEVPFERVVADLQPERDLSRSVMFQVLLVLQPPLSKLRFAGAPVQHLELGARAAQHDLELHLWDEPEIHGRLAFAVDLFEGSTIDRLLARFESLIGEVVADPTRRLSSLSILLPEEKGLLRLWGRGPDREIATDGLQELVEQQARTSPESPAVLFADEAVTYDELNRRANRFANHLRSLGVTPEMRVGICLERSIQMLVAVLGVLKAGAAYVPLDPRCPGDRLSFIVRDAQARVVVTEEALADLVAAGTASVVSLDRHREAIAQRSDKDLKMRIGPENLAYVLYTSGSTGRPKGVQVSHRALTNLVLAMRDQLSIERDDVVAATTTLSFDVAALELFVPLTVGATEVITSSDEVLDAWGLCDLLTERGVTVLQATPTVWRVLLETGKFKGGQIRALCGGEVLMPDLADQLTTSCASVWNLYGPTETTVWSSAHRVTSGAPISLGRPIANTSFHVVDEELREVPIGVVGELCIAGVGLSRGYIARPGLTAERFVPNPFPRVPGERLYRTGDLVRYRSDGTLEFMGRGDDQVKLRGHRIEPGEIEASLSSHPAVRTAVVVAQDEMPRSPRLLAYVVPSGGAGSGVGELPSQLLDYLRARLPAYMIPSAFVVLDALPRTPSGKVNRSLLPDPDQERPDLEEAYVAPRSSLEREVTELAAELLRLDRVGVRDDFFQLGGHSLLAARLVTEVRQRYGVDLPLHGLFETPRVEHLASLIEQELTIADQLSGEELRLRRLIDEIPDEIVNALLLELNADVGLVRADRASATGDGGKRRKP